jgi:hypothetical protein
MVYHYRSGEEIRVGDRVYTQNEKWGVVEQVIYPNSRASADYDCPEGGVLIIEDWDGEENPILFRGPEEDLSECLDFIGRAKSDNDTNKP